MTPEPAPTGPESPPATAVCSTPWPPNHFNVAEDLVAVPGKPPIVWLHGEVDAIVVSDTSLFDLAYLGSLGVGAGLAGDGGVSAAADDRSDPGGAGAVQVGRRLVP